MSDHYGRLQDARRDDYLDAHPCECENESECECQTN